MPFLERLTEALDRRRTLVFVVLAATGLLVAWLHRFVLDDAFISFTYARALVQGQGLTWFGTRVEGYTNFLWVLWSALGIRLGIEPVAWSWAGGLASFVLMLYAAWRVSLLAFRSLAVAVLAVLLLIGNFTVVSYATGGLETMLQAALLALAMAGAYGLHRDERPRFAGIAGLSLLLGAAVLTRPDSILPGAIIAAAAGTALFRRRASWRHWLLLLLPGALLVLPWLGWKLAYYGSLLPNSFHAKVGPRLPLLVNGLLYVLRFLHWYLIWPFLVLGTVGLLARRRQSRPLVWPLAAATGAWFGYVVLVGGDFMEFRFLVPVVAFLMVLLAWLVHEGVGRALLRRPLLAALPALVVLVAASALHAHRFRTQTRDMTLDSIHRLADFYGVYPDRDWTAIGSRLRTELAGVPVTLALDPVGAIPYYSGIRTVDLLGLNDPAIARRGAPVRPGYRRPGHQRHATLAQLERRGVNFVIGHPTFVKPGVLRSDSSLDKLLGWVEITAALDGRALARPSFVVVPLDRRGGLLMWYLTPTPTLDSLVAAKGWEHRTYDIVFSLESD